MHNAICFSLKKLVFSTSLWMVFSFVNAQKNAHPDGTDPYVPRQVAIPTAGNTWRSDKDGDERFNGDIVGWKNPQTSYTSYFRTSATGLLNIQIHAKSRGGMSHLLLSVDKKPFPVSVSSDGWDKIYAGAWILKDTGYHAVKFSFAKKDDDAQVDIDSIYVSGAATSGELVFVPDNEGNFYYWGRRGPSVHIGYSVPKGQDIEWFYNEVTVPVGDDPVGSYFMADGFSVGYFGFQVNAKDRRHVLFSVWSPFSTDRPDEIPADKKITMLKKGDKVHAGEFGGEGSGGQSYLNYPWKAGRTYRFLLHAHPNADSTTDFTAYFYTPEEKKWLLIASFRRPHTSTWLRGLHSFLENFDPEMGNVSRLAQYGNQWFCTNESKWIPANKARFTIDNTGRKNYRKDYAGGVEGSRFYLKNGGFFSRYTPADSPLTRSTKGDVAPRIDFSLLP